MAIEVPWSLTYQLMHDLDIYTRADLVQAEVLTGLIEAIAVAAAEDALAHSKSYTNSMVGSVRTDLTDSLNLVSAYLSDDIHILRQYIIEEMIPALAAIVGASGVVGGGISDGVQDAYEAIAETHKVVGDIIVDSIEAGNEQVTSTYGRVSEWVQDSLNTSLAALRSITKDLLVIPQALIDLAVEHLLPAESKMWLYTAGEILIGAPVLTLLQKAGSVFKEELKSVLTIDEEELKAWVVKGSEIVQSIALQTARSPRGI